MKKNKLNLTRRAVLTFQSSKDANRSGRSTSVTGHPTVSFLCP
ncbi:hypothetical protein [Sphingobacterium faecium]|nr:hypothetical protein [Sphingobacterium faecium]